MKSKAYVLFPSLFSFLSLPSQICLCLSFLLFLLVFVLGVVVTHFPPPSMPRLSLSLSLFSSSLHAPPLSLSLSLSLNDSSGWTSWSMCILSRVFSNFQGSFPTQLCHCENDTFIMKSIAGKKDSAGTTFKCVYLTILHSLSLSLSAQYPPKGAPPLLAVAFQLLLLLFLTCIPRRLSHFSRRPPFLPFLVWS